MVEGVPVAKRADCRQSGLGVFHIIGTRMVEENVRLAFKEHVATTRMQTLLAEEELVRIAVPKHMLITLADHVG